MCTSVIQAAKLGKNYLNEWVDSGNIYHFRVMGTF